MNRDQPRRGSERSIWFLGCGALLLFLILFGGCAISQYNGIVTKRESVDAQWSKVESDYKHRSDLIPQLIETVKGARDFESGTLQEVIEARSRATSIQISAEDLGDPAALEAYMGAQQAVGSALGRLLAVSESYPELQAVGAFRDLQTQLEGIGNRINVSRKDYITAVQNYNTAIKRFPGNLLANQFGFEGLAQFEAAEGDMDTPVIDFGAGE